jgi:glyoxylate reductase
VKILATRRLPGPAWDELREVEVGTLGERRDDVEALIVANERVDAATLDLLPSLRLVANYSVGYDQIDVEACRARGIAVTNTPGVLDAATADLAFALLLSARRRLVEGDQLVRAGGDPAAKAIGRRQFDANFTHGSVLLAPVGSRTSV